MNKEWNKMLAGEIYDATDPEILKKLNATKELVFAYNQLPPSQLDQRKTLLKQMLGGCGENILINQPFYCDYGCNIRVGENFFANFHFTVLDEALVTIGNDVFIGPNVSLYTACHPTDPVVRRTRQEWARPITIGNDVWIGGNVTILPGVSIGNGTTIGAGSVVVNDIPDHCIAVGNPCKVVRRL